MHLDKIKRLLSQSKYFPTAMSDITWTILILHTIYIIACHFESIFIVSRTTIGLVALSYCVVILYSQGIDCVMSYSKRIGIAILWSYAFIYGLLSSYLFAAKTSFDYAVFADNAHSALSQQAFSVILSRLKLDALLIALIAVGILHYRIKSKKATVGVQSHPIRLKLLMIGLIYGLFILGPTTILDEPTQVIKSIVTYHTQNISIDIETPYPYFTPGLALDQINNNPTKRGPRPNIIFVMVESFNAQYVERLNENGTAFTPVFNGLIKKGFYVETFYGNSVQTSKGKWSIFSSILPSWRGIIFREYEDLKVQTFPEILKKIGYTNIHLKASSITNFDNEQTFLKKNGYDIFESITPYLKKVDHPYIWNWGPEDKVFYKRAFEYLDTYLQDHPKTGPLFISLATIGNHTPFDVPQERRIMYKTPKTVHEKFANSLYLADKQLNQLLKEIKKRDYLANTILIITGDHSFPTRPNTANETSFYNDTFQIPFLMLGAPFMTPSRLDVSASQIDIAPTILEILELSHIQHHFQGKSLFKITKKDRPIFLVQPYNGTYLSVIKYPYKYIKRLKTGEELAFNIKEDAKEKNNIIDNISETALNEFRNLFLTFYKNQSLIKQNQIWQE